MQLRFTEGKWKEVLSEEQREITRKSLGTVLGRLEVKELAFLG